MKPAVRPPDRYFHGDREDLLSWLGGRHERVLEIGCGAGGNATWLREHGAARIVGVELDEASAVRAGEVFDRVLAESVETALAKLDETFDLIICADVLEHLVDPWAVVRDLARQATDDTTLLVSIPNVRYIRTLWDIALGSGFQYVSEGPFDRTHLRFFSRANVAGLLLQGGWRPRRWAPSPSRRLRFLRDLLWKVTGGRSGEFLAYQWYIAAKRASTESDRPNSAQPDTRRARSKPPWD